MKLFQLYQSFQGWALSMKPYEIFQITFFFHKYFAAQVGLFPVEIFFFLNLMDSNGMRVLFSFLNWWCFSDMCFLGVFLMFCRIVLMSLGWLWRSCYVEEEWFDADYCYVNLWFCALYIVMTNRLPCFKCYGLCVCWDVQALHYYQLWLRIFTSEFWKRIHNFIY